MLLLADSGSTKTDWYLLQKHQKKRFTTTGINPYFLTPHAVREILQKEVLSKLGKAMPNELYFYGAGCGDLQQSAWLKKTIRQTLGVKKIAVHTDMLGAARSLCGSNRGVVCILGTGSNACVYNGKNIVKKTVSLGYVLGDEGGGVHLGKKVIQHVLLGIFEPELQDRFTSQYTINRAQVLEAVYKNSHPNRYLAGFSKFLADNRGHYMIENILEDGMTDFLVQHVMRFPEAWNRPIHFTGSVAFAYRDVLADICKASGLELGQISANPMEGLRQFHIRNI